MSVPYKVLTTGGALVAGLVARQAVAAVWKSATGHHPPDSPEHPDSGWAEAVAWVVASSAALAAARLFAARGAARYYRRSTGHLPPKLKPA
ncbi:MAG: DUF4235 domain-containing protein [Actinomycetales bacterium]